MTLPKVYDEIKKPSVEADGRRSQGERDVLNSDGKSELYCEKSR